MARMQGVYNAEKRYQGQRDIPLSDIDIMILTSMSDDEIRDIENQVYDIAYDYQLSDNVMISVNIKNADHYNYWLGALPYYDNVEKEGVVLVG